MAVRYVYETPIDHVRLDLATEEAIRRVSRYAGASDLGHAFRVVGNSYSVSDEDGGHAYSTSKIELIAFPIVKRTDKGFRVRIGGWDHAPQTRWISFDWTKRFASLTVEEAIESFAARKDREASIYEARAKGSRSLAQRARAKLVSTLALA